MRRVWRILVCIGMICLLTFATSASWAQDADTAPRDNNGQKWRIGYLEGGAFPDYEVIFLRIVAGLMDLGWIKAASLPTEYDPDHRRTWEWVADNIQSDYLEFVKDAFYTSEFNVDLRQATKAELLGRLERDKDLDLILALGTWAGLDLANDQHTTATVVASTSNPLASGIIQSMDDSGFDHLHAKVEPERYARQLRLFHDIIGFTSMGLVYEDSVEGRTFAALDEAELVAKERGFSLHHCFARNNDVTLEQASAEVRACYEELAPQVEALYITVHRGEGLPNLPSLLPPLLEHNVATFAMAGSEFVRHGALLSIAQAGFAYVGRFHAETVAKIFNGAKPRDLPQRWNAPPKIAINLRTAEKIGFDPPFDILAAADEVYDQIEPVGGE
ncbi:ABC transporter substrate-binding protein [Desulfonatronum lacustre]|uniref:ABC transporter substrate-binding protein n=1 Tax=Desulfonatronum lacustre TaxID=66849 RepID=UPI00048E35D5|nr:ABC transporter substrate binding protein [Desulfonatronum lacustre]